MDADLALNKAKQAAEHAWESMCRVELANSAEQASLLIQTSLGWSAIAQTMLELYDITPDGGDVITPWISGHPSTRDRPEGGTVINISRGMRGHNPTHIIIDEINDGWAADDPDDGA